MKRITNFVTELIENFDDQIQANKDYELNNSGLEVVAFSLVPKFPYREKLHIALSALLYPYLFLSSILILIYFFGEDALFGEDSLHALLLPLIVLGPLSLLTLFTKFTRYSMSVGNNKYSNNHRVYLTPTSLVGRSGSIKLTRSRLLSVNDIGEFALEVVIANYPIYLFWLKKKGTYIFNFHTKTDKGKLMGWYEK